MVEHSPSFQTQRRNTTVVVAIWALGIIALLELIFVSIAWAPRVLTAARTSGGNAETSAVLTPTPTSVLSQGIQLPISRPLQSSPIREIINKDNSQTELPFKPVTSDSSLRGGSTLGIVSAKLDSISENSKKLVIAMKANPKEPIDVPQIKVQVYFYDSDGTEIAASKAQSISKWLSSGTDWKNGEPELLEVRYLPDSADSEIKFAGYVVAIYYKGDLQDYRAEPSRLTKLFPLKYFIGTEE